MSYKRICDRCGAVEPDNKPELQNDVWGLLEHRLRDKIDLCGKCYRIVLQFINDSKKDLEPIKRF